MSKKLKKMFPLFFCILFCMCIPMKVSAASVSARDTDGTQQVFRLAMTQPGVSNMSRALFAVWGDQNGQDDLLWYQAQQMSDGSYLCDVAVSNHGQAGGYTVHAYAEETDGSLTLLGYTSFQVTAVTTTATTARSVKTSDYNASAGTFQVWVEGIQSASGVSQVQIPVWCASDQSDIRWYNATRYTDGSFMAEVSIANHGNHTGRYQIHAYARENNGALTLVGGTTQDVSSAGAGSSTSKGKFSITERDGGASYQINLSGAQVPGMSGVQLAVWADQGGQDDLRWYGTSRSSDGTYSCTIPISNHGQSGTYNAHAYAVLSNGSMQLLQGMTFQVRNSLSAKVQVANVNASAGTFDIIISNIGAAGGVRTIQVPVWHAADQSDIKWYTARAQSNGTYVVSADVANHNYNTGNYNIHVYLMTNSGSMSCVCGTTANINVSAGGQPKVQVSNVNGSTGAFDITISNVSAPGGVRTVQVPVWHAADQSDIQWYTAQSRGNGTYTVSANVANHNYNTGNYNIHVYVTTNSGTMSCICGATTNINVNVSNIKPKVQATRISDAEYRISISAPGVSGSTAKVMFPTWSAQNGQDDIIWYEGVRSSDGVWYADVDGRRHGSPGTFITHVYTQINGQNTFMGDTSYTLNFAVQTRVASNANRIIGGVTNASMDSGAKLRACYDWTVNNISYQTLPIPLQPEAGYTEEEWYAIYGMEQQRGNCYCYAAAFAAMARQLGYSATMISGKVPLLAGGMGPHAWVEIYMNGATYICDPESQHENPAYGFYMTTYATAPYPYQK